MTLVMNLLIKEHSNKCDKLVSITNIAPPLPPLGYTLLCLKGDSSLPVDDPCIKWGFP